MDRSWGRLLVQTANTLYELEAIDGPRLMVLIRGGRHFLEPRRAVVAGARRSSTEITLGAIHVGLPLEIHSEGQVIVTSPVRRIELQPAVP